MSFDWSCPLPILDTDRILVGHGSGGKLTQRLLERHILPALDNPFLRPLDDQAILPPSLGEKIAFTTDSYVVSPIFFPGGDIGSLAVHGTVNDLVVGGARPIALSLSLILEEGLPLSTLDRILASIREAAYRAEVPIVTGDTKVVEKGCADQIFINTAGIGLVPPGLRLGASRVEPGDEILVSGPIGDHGIAILALREGLELEGEVQSDTAPLGSLVRAILDACPEVHAMRDPTRGGVAASLVEIATRQNVGIEIDAEAIPVRDAVRGACELFGLDPLLVANEGKLLVFVPGEESEAVLAAMRAHPLGRDAVRIGRVCAEHRGLVVVRTAVGGRRILDLPFAEQLPRIC